MFSLCANVWLSCFFTAENSVLHPVDCVRTDAAVAYVLCELAARSQVSFVQETPHRTRAQTQEETQETEATLSVSFAMRTAVNSKTTLTIGCKDCPVLKG